MSNKFTPDPGKENIQSTMTAYWLIYNKGANLGDKLPQKNALFGSSDYHQNSNNELLRNTVFFMT